MYRITGLLLLIGLGSLAQSDEPKNARLEFEVASIKPHPPEDRHIIEMMRLPGGRFNGRSVTVKLLMSMAYSVQDYQISGGPGWVDSESYDIVAKSEDASNSKLPERVQALLEDRFKLKLHRDSKEMPIYVLTVGKGGSKLKESAGDCPPRPQVMPRTPAPGEMPSVPCGGMLMARSQVSGEKVAIPQIATYLSRVLGRPVVDKTGLASKYDIKLEWTPDQSQVRFGPADPGQQPPPPDNSGPSIFTALQEQLGLKLESQRGPVEVLVIDHVEHPSEN